MHTIKRILVISMPINLDDDLQAPANGLNIVGKKPPTTRNNVVTCCVRLHGPHKGTITPANSCFVVVCIEARGLEQKYIDREAPNTFAITEV